MENLNQQMLDAAVRNNLVVVEELVARGADINYIDQWNNCAIFTAAWEGNLPALELYTRLGATFELEDNNPLCNSAYNGQVNSVRWLLEHGANPKHRSTALRHSATKV